MPLTLSIQNERKFVDSTYSSMALQDSNCDTKRKHSNLPPRPDPRKYLVPHGDRCVLTDGGYFSPKKCKFVEKNQLSTFSVSRNEQNEHREPPRSRKHGSGSCYDSSDRSVSPEENYEYRESELEHSHNESSKRNESCKRERKPIPGKLVSRVAGTITYVRHDSHQVFMKVALRESTHPQEGICSYKNQECLVYWRTGVPKNVVFEKGSGVVLYNMFETTSRFGETLYRTPTKADDDSLDSTVICYIWVRKDGFLTTNLTRTLNMRTELELAQLAREEYVGFFEKTKIPRWKRFDLKHLKNLCPANASSNTNWLSNTSRHREKTSPKTENGNVCELTKKVSTGDEYHRLSDDQPSEAPLRESFPTPIALDAKVKLPVQSHTGNYFNDRYSKLLDWKTSDNLGKYKARGSRKFCASSDLWKGVSSLGSLQTDPIDISDNRAPESESFIPSDEKHLRYPVKCQNRTTESKNGVEQAFKPSDIEVITISDDDDDTPLNRGKLSEDNAVNKHHSSSSYPMPSSFEPRQESKPIPPNAKLVVVSPASKGKAIPKKSSHTASSMASGEAPSFSQSQPTPTSETPPPLHLNSPAEKLDNLEAHYGPWKLRGAIDMISFIPSEEKHDQQQVNHIHYILTRNFRYTNHRFEWRKGHRELFDKDPELENPRTKKSSPKTTT